MRGVLETHHLEVRKSFEDISQGTGIDGMYADIRSQHARTMSAQKMYSRLFSTRPVREATMLRQPTRACARLSGGS